MLENIAVTNFVLFGSDESFETNQQFLSPGSLSFLANLDIISRYVSFNA